MSSTAFDGQFTVGTQTTEPIRQPHDIVSILQRNVADLEIALKRQTERAEAAEAELEAVRDDNHSMMLEIHNLRIERDALVAELAKLRKQKPVAFWWTGLDGEPYGGPYRGTPSDAAIDNARNSGCSPQYLYAGPVPAVAAGLPAIGPYRDFIPAPAVPDWNVNIERIRDVMHMLGISIEESVECFSAALPTNINRMTLAMKRHLQKLAGMTAAPAPSVPEEWREVMTELADDLAIEIDQSYPPERRAYPSEQRRYEGEMAIVNRARALLQSEVRHD